MQTDKHKRKHNEQQKNVINSEIKIEIKIERRPTEFSNQPFDSVYQQCSCNIFQVDQLENEMEILYFKYSLRVRKKFHKIINGGNK